MFVFVRSFSLFVRTNEQSKKRVSVRVISNGYAQLVGSVGSVGRMGSVGRREHHLTARPITHSTHTLPNNTHTTHKPHDQIAQSDGLQ